MVLGSQAMYDDFTRWPVLELEQESLQHGLHCPHKYRNFMSVRVVAWEQDDGALVVGVVDVRANWPSAADDVVDGQGQGMSPGAGEQQGRSVHGIY